MIKKISKALFVIIVIFISVSKVSATELTDTDTKILKCHYRDKSFDSDPEDYSGLYGGISLQLVIDVSESVKSGSLEVTPQFYFPTELLDQLKEDKWINDKNQIYDGNRTYSTKTIYGAMSYDSKTKKVSNWKGVIDALNDAWSSDGYYEYSPFAALRYDEFKNVYEKSVTIRIDDTSITNKSDLFIDSSGEAVCPKQIGILIPEKEDVDARFGMGYYDGGGYQTVIILDGAYSTGTHYTDCTSKEPYNNQGENECTYAIGSGSNTKLYGSVWIENSWSDEVKNSAEEKKELEDIIAEKNDNSEGILCSDVDTSKYKIGTSTRYTNMKGTCYFKSYTKSGSESNYELIGINFNNTNTYGAWGIYNIGTEFAYDKAINGSQIPFIYQNQWSNPPGSPVPQSTSYNCNSFYYTDKGANGAYLTTTAGDLCGSKYLDGSEYFCACKFVGVCEGSYADKSGQKEKSGYWDCSNCTGYEKVQCGGTSQKYKCDEIVCGFICEGTWGYIKNFYTIVKILVPVLVILLGIIDFMKVVLSGDDKDMKKAGQTFLKRIIAGVVFILLPVLLEFLMELVGFSENCFQHLWN